MADNLRSLKAKFLEYLEIEKGCGVKTIETYDRHLTRFLARTKLADPGQLTEPVVRRFRLWLNRQPGVGGTMKKRTQNGYMVALRAFLKYLRRIDIPSLQPEKIELAKAPGRDLDLITA
jgi:site-specific recombinase XerD